MTVSGTASSRKVRAFVLAGTALGCSLAVAGEASAQASGNITYNGPGPYTLIQTTPVSGGPRAVDVTVTSGDAVVDTTATTVDSVNTGTGAGVGIGVSNTGAGDTTVRTGNVTLSGSGPGNGIDARVTTGTLTIANTGTVAASGNATDNGIVARSGGGDVVVDSNVASGQRYGIIVTGNGGSFGTTGTTTITSASATANGTGLVNAIVGQGSRVVITSGTATNASAGGVQGTAIFANAGAGGVLLNAGTTTALGQNQAAIQVFSGGAVDVTSGTVRTTQTSDGLSIASGTDVIVRSQAITTEGAGGARGLVLGGNSGGGGFNSGPNGFAYTSATVTSGSITTAGAGAYGIYATPDGAGTTTITSGAITTAGAGATGILVAPIGTGAITGSTTINSTGALRTSGAGAVGIQVETGRAIQSVGTPAASASTAAITIANTGSITTGGGPGTGTTFPGAHGISVLAEANPVTIGSNAITTAGAGAHGILVRPGAGIASTGPVTIDSATIRTGGTSALGMLIQGSGGMTIRSGTITTTGAGVSTGIQAGIAAGSAGSVAITSDTIAVTNANSSGSGIVVTAGSTGATTINSGAITVAGQGGGGISVNAPAGATGDITVNSRDITIAGPATTAFRPGITLFQTAGTTTVNSTGTITSPGVGIIVQARAGQPAGAVNITSNVINSSANGIQIDTGSSVTIDAASTATSADNAAAITVSPLAGALVTVRAGTITTTGANALGVNASTNVAGTTAITVANATTTGSAVDARTAGDLAVTTGTARVAGGTATGVTAISSGGTATVSSTDLAVTNGRGIFAQGLDTARVTSGTLAVTGAGNQAIFAQTTSGIGAGVGTAEGVVTVDSTTLTSDGGGINAFGPRASVTVNSGSVTVGLGTGIGAFGINSTVNSGSVVSKLSGIEANFGTGALRLGNSVVNSGTVAIDGTDAAGVSGAITANNQNVTINSGTIANTGLGNRFGISAQGVGGPSAPGNVDITSGSITTVGDGAYGIQAIASAGAVTINSTGTITTAGTTRIAGTQPRYSAGIIAVAQNGAVAVTSNAITTIGAQSDGIRVEAGSGIASYGQGTIGVAPIAVTTTGLTRTAGADAAGINVLGGGGAVTVANTGTIATTGDRGFGISLSPAGGAAVVTSAAVSTTGAGATGIRVAGTTGTVALTAQTVTTTGLGATAIDLRTGGAVTVDTSNASAVSGTATLVRSGGLATVRAGTVRGGGDGGAGVSVTGGTGVALSVGSAASTGAAITAADGTVMRADAIFLEATTGAITAAIGSAAATGAGADGVRLIANGDGGSVSAAITGTVTSAGGYGLFIDPPGAVVVSVANGARVTGATGGIFAEGGSVAITNAGTISSTGDAAITAVGPATVDNSGTITGTGGTAVRLGAANDVVTLRTGSAVTGAIVGGGGTDAAVLIGTGTAPAANQTVAGFTGFDSLTVQSGYWTAPAATAGTVARTVVNGGASLELQNGATGIAGYRTGTVANAGQLVIRSSAASAGSTFGATTVTGTGGVTFTGTGLTTLDGTNTLANTGTNLIDGGTVLVTGTQGGNFATGGTGTLQVGTGGATGSFTGNLANNGALIVNRSNDVAFNGALTGAGLFVKEGAGRITFGTGYAFTGTTQLNGGAIRLTGPVAATTELDVRGTGQIDLSGTNQTIAELQGNSAAASVNIAGGALTVNQATTTTFAGAIVGAGSLTKAGTGTLNLTGSNTYTGPTSVNGGRLLVNGSIVSPVTVNAGGTLGGTGSVGSTAVASGGVWAPGNSIGTQTVNGNVAFAAGSTYQVEVNAAGAADRIAASGTATLGGRTVQVLAESGTYARQTGYTILTANAGVSGRFANVTSNFAFLTPLLGYSATAVTLTLARNDLAFGAVATTPNQLAAADAIFARGATDPLFGALLFQSTAAAQTSFTALAGELNAGLATELTDNGRRVRQAVLDRGAVRAEGIGLWADGLQSAGRSDADPDRARLTANRTGVVGGIDYATGTLRIGLFGGYQDDDIRLRGRASTAEVDTTYAGAHAAFTAGPISLQAGGAYAWHDVDTARDLGAAGFGAVTGKTDASSTQLFAEAGYALTHGAAVVTPFLSNAYTWTRVDAFTEAGGTGALGVARDRREVGLASAGVRLAGEAALGGATFLPRMSIAYQRGYGDLRGEAVQRFGGTGPAFTVAGARLGKDGLAIDGGFDLRLGGFSVGLGAQASTTNHWSDYGGKAMIGLRF